MWTIGGVEVIAPRAARVEVSPSTSSGERNLLGEAVMDFWGEKRSLKLVWKHLDEAALGALFGAAGAGFFAVSYPDPDGGQREITCYLHQRRAGLKLMRGGRPVWTEIEMELMER